MRRKLKHKNDRAWQRSCFGVKTTPDKKALCVSTDFSFPRLSFIIRSFFLSFLFEVHRGPCSEEPRLSTWSFPVSDSVSRFTVEVSGYHGYRCGSGGSTRYMLAVTFSFRFEAFTVAKDLSFPLQHTIAITVRYDLPYNGEASRQVDFILHRPQEYRLLGVFGR